MAARDFYDGKLDADAASDRCTELSRRWIAGEEPDTPQEVLEPMRQEFFQNFCKRFNEELLKDVWMRVLPYMNNPGCAEFSRSMGGAKSRTHWRWLEDFGYVDEEHPYGGQFEAMSLELSYGWARDIDGKLKPILLEDPMYAWVDKATGLLDIRFRTNLAAKRIVGAAKVMEVGSGMMPIFRHTSFRPETKQEFYTCDKNLRMTPKEVLGAHDPRLAQIHHATGDMVPFLMNPAVAGEMDVVLALGMATYVPDLAKFLALLLKPLRIGGELIFDMQIRNWDLERDFYVFRTTKTEPQAPMLMRRSAATIRVEVGQIAQAFGAEVEFFAREVPENELSAITCVLHKQHDL